MFIFLLSYLCLLSILSASCKFLSQKLQSFLIVKMCFFILIYEIFPKKQEEFLRYVSHFYYVFEKSALFRKKTRVLVNMLVKWLLSFQSFKILKRSIDNFKEQISLIFIYFFISKSNKKYIIFQLIYSKKI